MKQTLLNDFNRRTKIVRMLLWGTTAALILLMVLLCYSFVIGNHHVAPRIWTAVGALLYLAAAWVMLRRGRLATVSWMMIVLYTALATLIVFEWGINTAAGIVLYGFIIIVSGVLLGSHLIIPVMLGIVVILSIVQVLTYAGLASTDYSLFNKPSTFADVGGYAIILAIFALVAWLSDRQMEQSLTRALRAEMGLAREKTLLSVRLEQKSREVREAQLEEMRQLYQFAELGQLGAVLLHDLANNLTALTLDIDDIGRRLQRNESITRAKESIAYIETMVNGVRRQIHERDKPVVFNAVHAVLETVAAIGPRARRAGVTIEFVPATKQPFYTNGDPIRFAHILMILMSNAIDAYDGVISENPSIIVTARVRNRRLHVEVTDHGNGITAQDRERLFKPFSSTKPDGMGIGLFMALEMTERHFNGSLTIDPSTDETTFILEVPRARGKGSQYE